MSEKRKPGRPHGSKNKPKEYFGYTLVPLQTLLETLESDCPVPVPTSLANEILAKVSTKTNIIKEEEKKTLVEGVDYSIENV